MSRQRSRKPCGSGVTAPGSASSITEGRGTAITPSLTGRCGGCGTSETEPTATRTIPASVAASGKNCKSCETRHRCWVRCGFSPPEAPRSPGGRRSVRAASPGRRMPGMDRRHSNSTSLARAPTITSLRSIGSPVFFSPQPRSETRSRSTGSRPSWQRSISRTQMTRFCLNRQPASRSKRGRGMSTALSTSRSSRRNSAPRSRC